MPARTRRKQDEQPAAASDVEEPRFVGELQIVADEDVFSDRATKTGIPPVQFHGIRRLTLSDGTVVFECVERDFIGALPEVQVHRGQEHSAAKPGRRAAEPMGVPGEIRAMRLGEILHLAAGVVEWERLFEQQAAAHEDQVQRLRTELVDARQRASAAEQQLRTFERLLGRVGYTRVEDEG